MTISTRRRADRVDGYVERLQLIDDALALVEDERLVDAIANDDQGRLLRRVLANVRQLASLRSGSLSGTAADCKSCAPDRRKGQR